MTRFRYYADTPDGALLFTEQDIIRHNDSPEPGLPRGTYAARRDGAVWTGTTWKRSWHRITRTIEYKSNPSRHECNAKCQSARGRICECSCNGRNHGRFGFGASEMKAAPMPLFAEAC